jgi:hypothetical protein
MGTQLAYGAAAWIFSTTQNQGPTTTREIRNAARLCNSLNGIFDDDSLTPERTCGALKSETLMKEEGLKSVVFATDISNAEYFNDFSGPSKRNIQLFSSLKITDNQLYFSDENSEWNRVNPAVYGKSAGLLRAIPILPIFDDGTELISLSQYFQNAYALVMKEKDSNLRKSAIEELEELKAYSCSTRSKLAALPLFLQGDEDSESNQDNDTLTSTSTTASSDSSMSVLTITALDTLRNLEAAKLILKKVSIGTREVPRNLILLGSLQPQIYSSVADVIRTATGNQESESLLDQEIHASPKALALVKKGFVTMVSDDSQGLDLLGLHNLQEFGDKEGVAKLKKQIRDLEDEKTYSPLAPDHGERYAAVMANSPEPTRERIKAGHLTLLRLWGREYVSLLVADSSPCLNWFEALAQTYPTLKRILKDNPMAEVLFCEWFVFASRLAIRQGMMAVARAACKTVAFDKIEWDNCPVDTLTSKLIVKAEELKYAVPLAPQRLPRLGREKFILKRRRRERD